MRASAHAPTSDAVIAKPLSERAARQRPGRGRDSVGGLALLVITRHEYTVDKSISSPNDDVTVVDRK